MIIHEHELADATRELSEHTHEEIERQTAVKWGARAIVAYESCTSARSPRNALDWFSDAEDYFREALEHSALAEQPGLTEAIERQVREARGRAIRSLT